MLAAGLVVVELAALIVDLLFPVLKAVGSAVYGRLVGGVQEERIKGKLPESAVREPQPSAGTYWPAQKQKSERPRWRRLLRVGLVSMIGATAAALLFINFFFLEPTVRWFFDDFRERSGIVVSFESVRGNLLTGDLQFEGLTCLRRDSDSSTFDLDVDRARIDLAVIKLLAGGVRFGTVEVTGLSGEYTIKGRRGPPAGPRRHFEVDQLSVCDARVTVIDESRQRPLTLQATVLELESAPLRSRQALFDVLFASRCHGSINGSAFSLEPGGDAASRRARWEFDGLPISLAAAYVGGPLNLMQSGSISARFEHHWAAGANATIVTECEIALVGFSAAVPEDVSGAAAAATIPLVEYLNRRSDRVAVEFAFTLDAGMFHGAYAVSDTPLWKSISDSLADALENLAAGNVDKIEQIGRSLLNKLRGPDLRGE